ncbi:MAG: energy transducer TonB, partial [Novosphingobium sp.]|nr:energy transducer TonB [Novosphingobium sp.]
VTRSSGSEELDQATCPMIQKRARFKPAADDNGNPREGSYSSSVAWRIPKD